MSSRLSFMSTTGLIRSPSSATLAQSPAPTQASSGSTKSGKPSRGHKRIPNDSKTKATAEAAVNLRRLCGNSGVIPLGPLFIVGMAVVISLSFIVAVSFAFIGGEAEPVFKDILNDIARDSPGILLIADDVDIDVDEPAVTLRWTILACGQNYTLPGSEGTHGSSSCGIPSMPLFIYVDSEEAPTAIYDPSQLPFTSGSNERLRVQNLHQFDSDNVLDVHEARLYPFDTYHLSSTLRAVDSSKNQTVPIVRLLTITDTSSFIVSSSDSASYYTPASDTSAQNPSRNLEMSIKRPGEARFFALMLFGVGWMLAHASVAYVALAWKADDTECVVRYLAYAVVSMLVIPQVRNAMPDAPGLDGILIDQIGFFSQMLLTGIAIITLLATLARRELASFEMREQEIAPDFVKERPAPLSQGLHRLRGGSSTSVDFRHIRNLSMSMTTRRTTVEPPSPIAEYKDNSPYSPFADSNRAGGGFQPLSMPTTKPPRLSPGAQSVQMARGSSTLSARPLNDRSAGPAFSEWV